MSNLCKYIVSYVLRDFLPPGRQLNETQNVKQTIIFIMPLTMLSVICDYFVMASRFGKAKRPVTAGSWIMFMSVLAGNAEVKFGTKYNMNEAAKLVNVSVCHKASQAHL